MTTTAHWIRVALAAASIAATATPLLAQQRLNAAQSEIVFITKQMGVPVEGRFRAFSADAKIDAQQPQSSTVTMRVDLASISFASPEVVQEAKGADWLNTPQFPGAEFRSTTVRALEGNGLEVTGQLSLRGKTRPLTFPVTLTRSGTQTQAQGQFTLNRNDFGIGSGAWADPSLVANDVVVRFRFQFTDG